MTGKLLRSPGVTRTILESPRGDFSKLYRLGKKLGSGQFGVTFICAEIATGEHYACKVISKSKIVQQEEVECVLKEIAIMHHVTGQPNIIGIKEAFEDRENVYMVMDLCKGGPLFDRIVRHAEDKGYPYSEKAASKLLQQVVSVVERCHSLGVIHRDLKPENFLFKTKEEDSELVAIDFGLSTWHTPGEGHTQVCGSLLYMAPELVRWSKYVRKPGENPPKYGPAVDVWSAGVIGYIMLSGFAPYDDDAHRRDKIFEAILEGKLEFDYEPWPTISTQAKELLAWMLHPDPEKRPTAHEVLCHPWIASDGVAPSEPLPPLVADRLKNFASLSKFRRIATEVIACGLKTEEIAGLREMFKMFDTDKSGTITIEELRSALLKLGVKLAEGEIERMMDQADIDKSGVLEYEEFLACTLNRKKVDTNENLLKAFNYFDLDGSGFIQRDEMVKACERFHMTDKEIDECMRDADINKDGMIDYIEFVTMMRQRMEEDDVVLFNNGKNEIVRLS